MTKLEAVARAICNAILEDSADARSSMGGHPMWVNWLPQARAAVEALREPSEGMITAWVNISPAFKGTGAARNHAKKVWQAMIDAILEEGDG